MRIVPSGDDIAYYCGVLLRQEMVLFLRIKAALRLVFVAVDAVGKFFVAKKAWNNKNVDAL
jgi:hypothetical protein